jgi:AraC-like DNA-binding protein
MIYPANTDIIPLLKNTVQALLPYAAASDVKLKFTSSIKSQVFKHHPKELIETLSSLICHIINFLTAGNTIEICAKSTKEQFIIEVANTGTDLSRIREITDGIKACLKVTGTGNGTTFQYFLPLKAGECTPTINRLRPTATSYECRGYYAIIRKRLRSHFSKADNLVALLSNHHPTDAAFLEQINMLIRTNIENENFDTSSLCREMSMSRSKLFRRLKTLIRQAPAHYIRVMRLEKAKELLETTELNIAEVTFKTGFHSQSHFTKVFIQHYGVAPSLFRRKPNGTK